MSNLRDKQKKLNDSQLNLLHPKVKSKFVKFCADCIEAGMDLRIISGLRSVAQQEKLYNNYIASGKTIVPAAPPGYSYHNYGCAIDVYVWDETKQQFVKDYNLYKKIESIAIKNDLYWLANWRKSEMWHFEYNKVNVKKLKDNNQIDEKGYVLLDGKITENNSKTDKIKTEQISSEIGSSNIEEKEIEKDIQKKDSIDTITKIEEFNAVGIWQIIKLVSDQYSLSQNINDGTIAFDQGSLINFVKKVVQEPWLEFFGDTVNDQYYFQVRKEPFDLIGWRDVLLSKSVRLNDVISDDLSWYNGPIYSWYQIIPKGSFLGDKDLIYQYVTAVFFEEYAEVWGSKPLSQVSNYLHFIKISDGKIMLEKAFEDLRYMVESNMYLPFTRQGTITIKGDYYWKRGQKLNYLPTGEEFYIDSVSHSYSVSENGPNFLTTLSVTRGMVTRYVRTPENDNDISYWNLILFSEPEAKVIKYEEKIPEKISYVYFDNNRGYLIDLNESFEGNNDTVSKKMLFLINAFPALRKQLSDYNNQTIEAAVELIKKYPTASFICTGYVDSDFGGKTPILAIKRAENLKNNVINRYIEKYKNSNRQELDLLIKTLGAVNYVTDDETTNQPIVTDKNTPLSDAINTLNDQNTISFTKALQRFATFKMLEYNQITEKTIPQEGIAWRVNDPVFQFFLKRKQQNDCNIDVKKYSQLLDNIKNKPI